MRLSRIGLSSVCAAICIVSTTILPIQTYAADSEAAESIEHLRHQSKAFASIVKQVGPAVVHIQVEKKAQPSSNQLPGMDRDMLRRFFEEQLRGRRGAPPSMPREYVQRGQGSGFIVSPDGYILTNNHVIEQASKITVLTDDEKEWTATLVGADPESDVALIKIEGSDLPSLHFGTSQQAEIGEWVLALGSPFGFSRSVTAGIVSAKGRDRVGIVDYENFIQTDAAINPGNSGGPLVNLDGEVIGINTAIYSRSGGSMGIGFAIPIDMVKPIFKQLKDSGSVERGFIGVMIQDIDNELAEGFGLDSKRGALISDVMPDSPAEKAGLKAGDVVSSFNGKAMKTMQEFRRHVAMVRPGQEVPIRVLRNGVEQKLVITVGKRDATQVAVEAAPDISAHGLKLKELSEDVAEVMNLDYGVLISEVVPNSPAARAGLNAGDVVLSIERKRLTAVKQAYTELNAAFKRKGKALVLVHDGNGARYGVIKKDKEEQPNRRR